MKAVRFHETGTPEVLRVDEIPKPVAQAGEVLIRIEAAGVNYADVVRRKGEYYPYPTHLPHIAGSEIAGIVVAVGENVSSDLIGNRVVGPCDGGAYAEYIALPERAVFPVPEGLDAVTAAAIFVQGLTAAFVLSDLGRIKGGEAVFVQGAAGGVGAIALQLARLFGATTVLAGAGSDDRRSRTLDLGVDHAVDYTQPDWPDRVRALTDGHGVDLMLEMIGGDVFHQGLNAMAELGRVVVYGFASGQVSPVMPPTLMQRGLTLSAFHLMFYLKNRERTIELLDQMAGWIRSGDLRIDIGKIFSLADAADAHQALEERSLSGKLIIVADDMSLQDRPL